jgi:hypothetical protein
VPEDDRAVAVKVLVEGDSVVGAIEKLHQCTLAALERRASKIPTVELD